MTKNSAYLDFRVLPDPEFPPTVLMNSLFSKVHRRLVGQGEGRIGISLPGLREGIQSPGDCLRLHGPAEVLHGFMETDWLVGMRDHVVQTGVLQVPAGVRHRVVRRVQAKSSPARLRRRLMARKGISAEEAVALLPDSCARYLKHPFLTVESSSTQQRFRLFIEHLPLQDQSQPGLFSSYGLSSVATIPWF